MRAVGESSPTWPCVSRKATKVFAEQTTFFGGPSGAGSSLAGRHGSQYWRSSSQWACASHAAHELVCLLSRASPYPSSSSRRLDGRALDRQGVSRDR